MTRSERLNPVHRLAEEKENTAAQAFGTSQSQLQESSNRLAELMSYRDDYRNRLREATEHGIDARALREYQSFLKRLDQAIQQQQRMVTQGESEVARTRQGWLEERANTKSLSNLIGKIKTQEDRVSDRAEQLDSDERAQRMAKNKNFT